MPGVVEPTPWDKAALGRDTFELAATTPEAMAAIAGKPGHYTVRVDPLADKGILHANGFYYCDTLVEPHCSREHLRGALHPDATLGRDAEFAALLPICHGAFLHGRFHRDFNIDRAAADRRYDEWLRQLHAAGRVHTLRHRGAVAGFIAVEANKLALHAVAAPYRGQGLSKYWWTALCNDLFDAGHHEVISSISITNVPALNLYASLGFRFRNPLDIYHGVIK